jgi:hypothetical protein
MSSARFTMNPGAIDRILHGPDSISARKVQANRIKHAWQGNINTITGVTANSIEVQARGNEVVVEATSTVSGDNPSAWYWLEYGTGAMRAQHPGRRSLRGG